MHVSSSSVAAAALSFCLLGLTTAESSATSSGVMTSSKPIPTSFTPAQSSKIVADIESYRAGLLTQSDYQAAERDLLTAIPMTELAAAQSNPTSYLAQMATATAEPSWFTGLPEQDKKLFSSVASVQSSIVVKDTSGAGRAMSGPLSGWWTVGMGIMGAGAGLGMLLL